MAAGNPLTITNSLDRAVRWFSSNEAVVDSCCRLNFGELDLLSRLTASLLTKLGATRGQPVALLMVPSAIYLVAWLGAMRLGAIPVALHVRESAENTARVCDRIGPAILIYDASLEPLAATAMRLSGRIRAMIRAKSALPLKVSSDAKPVATIPQDLPGCDADIAPHCPREDDPAVISISSGTTSIPKGVVHTQRSLIELARTDQYLYGGIRPGDRSLVPLSTAFIGCLNGWLPFLNAAATSVFVEQFDLRRLAHSIEAEKISHIFLTPTLWKRFLKTDLEGVDFGSVRMIGFAAEVMDAATLMELRQRISSNVVQMYGATETGAAATCIWADDMNGDRLTSVGRPMINGDIRIVSGESTSTAPLPPGEIGEILVSTPSLAEGLWRDPEKTEASFVELDGKRWWRSRDLGRIDSEGFLTLIGRHDDMIISGGINIMPAAVEEVLLGHPDISECAVYGLPHPEWGEQVCALIVARDPALTEDALELFVQNSELSPYQRPRRYDFGTELPRTPTNKVNRRKIREVMIARIAASRSAE